MTGFLDFQFYYACQAERFIPEVLVACFCGWIRATRTLGMRLGWVVRVVCKINVATFEGIV